MAELGSIPNVFHSKAYMLLLLHLFVKHKTYFLFYIYFTFYPFIR